MTQDADPEFLLVEDVLELHADQLRLFGGSAGLRDSGALESAVATPAATFLSSPRDERAIMRSQSTVFRHPDGGQGPAAHL